MAIFDAFVQAMRTRPNPRCGKHFTLHVDSRLNKLNVISLVMFVLCRFWTQENI